MKPEPGADPIVLGIDFSPASQRALQTAIRMAKDAHTSVLLVHALRPLGSPGLDLSHPQYDPIRNETADVTASRPETAEAWLQAVRQRVPAQLVSREGRPADVLLEEAERAHASTIVVGSHGATALEKRVLGSVAEEILTRSPLPVVIVPGRLGTDGNLEPEPIGRPPWLE